MNPVKPAALKKILEKNGKSISAPYISAEMVRDPPTLTVVTQGKTGSGKPRLRIDLDGKETQAFIKRRIGHIPTADSPAPAQKKPPKKRHVPIDKQLADVPALPKLPQLSRNPGGKSGPTGTDDEVGLKEENLELKNEKLRIENGQKRGKLIEKTLVTTVFDRLAGIDENQFKSLAVRVGPKIESSLADSYDFKTTEILSLLGREDDADLKTDIQKIMNSGGSDRIRGITEIIEEDTGKILKNIQYEFGKFLERCEQ